jgi:polar amino acid transport system substrate-binding protein
MKKLIALLLALVMCTSLLAGCGAKEDTTATDTDTTTDTTDTADTTATDDAQASDDTASDDTADAESNPWDAAVGQTYIVGTDTTFAPFEFENDEGVHTGIDIELLDAIAEEMGFTVEWQVLGFTASVTALEAKQVDAVMAGMSITDERQLKYDFSESYYDCPVAVAVSDTSSYTSAEELAGKTVVAKTGTTGAKYAQELADQYGMDLLLVEESSLMYTYVQSGQAEACFEDYPIIQYEINRGNVSCKVIGQSDYSYPTGFATIKDAHPELIAAFNEGFNRLKENGTYDAILTKYFG